MRVKLKHAITHAALVVYKNVLVRTLMFFKGFYKEISSKFSVSIN